MLTTMTVAPGCELSDGFWRSVFRVSLRICLSSCLSLQASEHLRFSPGEAQPEREAAGEAVREAGPEGGEPWPSEPVTRSVSTEKEPQPATCLSLFKTASAPGSSRKAVVPSMASILLQTCDRGRHSHGSSSAGAEMARERGGVGARRGAGGEAEGVGARRAASMNGGESTAAARRGARRTFAKLGRRRASCCQHCSIRSTNSLEECAGISGRFPLVATESATSTGVCCGKGIE